MRAWKFKDGPEKGHTVVMFRPYFELTYPSGKYLWDEEKEDYIWHPGTNDRDHNQVEDKK